MRARARRIVDIAGVDARRFNAFSDAMDADVAITAQQLRRWHGLLVDDIKAACVIEKRFVKKAQNHRGKFLRVTFIVNMDNRPFSSTDELRHTVCTAEIRRVLGVAAKDWRSAAWAKAATMQPDALWRNPEGNIVAIECDTGAYSRARILKKAEAFAEKYEAGQVWGCVTEARADNVRRLVRQVDPGAEVVVADPYVDDA